MSLEPTELIKIENTHPDIETLIKTEVLADEKLKIPAGKKSKCGEIFSLHSGSFILICGFCGGQFDNMRLFGRHVQQKHPDCIYQPEIDPIITAPPDPTSICVPIIEETELQISADELSDECGGEEESSSLSSSESEDDSDRMESQILKASEAAGLTCDGCNRTYKSKESLRRHKKNNKCKQTVGTKPTGDPDLFCRICFKQIKTRKKFTRHQRDVHGIKLKDEPNSLDVKNLSFCDLCNRFFKSKLSFHYHVKKMHDSVLPLALQNDLEFLKCKFCNQQFSDYSKKIQHETAHTEERPYICSYCPKTFTSNTLRTKHMKRHSKTREYSCDVCGNGFVTKRDLTTHMSRHTGERPFVCEECGLTFPVQSQLNYHQKRHTEQKDFRCDICQKGFYSLSTLKEHRIGHTGEQPFICDICGRRFSRIRAHNKHKKLHSGVKDYVCNICGKAYAQDSGLYAHKKSHFKQ